MTIRPYRKDGRWREHLELVFGWAEWDAADRVVVGDRLLPRVIEIVAVGGRESIEPRLSIVVTVVDGVPLCSLLAIERRENGRGVQASDLRGIRLDDWIEEILAAASMHVESVENGEVHATTGAELGGPEELAARKAVRAMRRSGRRKVTDELLSKVAKVYRDNQKTGKPARAVEIAFSTSQRTAARWISLARERGML